MCQTKFVMNPKLRTYCYLLLRYKTAQIDICKINGWGKRRNMYIKNF